MNIPGMLPANVSHSDPHSERRREMEGLSGQLCRQMTPAARTKPPSSQAPAGPSNTNGNANCDVAGVGLKNDSSSSSSSSSSSTSSSESALSDQAGSRLHPISHDTDSAVTHFHHVLSPVTPSASCMNGAASSSDISLGGSGKMEHEAHLHGLTSPIIADLPLMSMRSPPLSLDFTAAENGGSNLHSPGGTAVAMAKYPSFTQVTAEGNTISSSSDSISCSSLSPIASISASSPSSSVSAPQQQPLFQQGLLLDPRSPALLIQSGLTAVSPTTSQPIEESMDESGPFICHWENCNQEFPLLESLVVHLDRGHTISMDKYVCLWKDCARSRKPFDARYKLITHLRCHTGEKPYRCEYPTCTRSFSRLENLKLHVRTHTGEKPYECHYEGCIKKFNNTSDRAKHMKTHITRKPYVCKYPGCGKSYTDPSSMRKHIKYTHKLKERQEEAGYDGGLQGLSNGPLSHQRGSRKRDGSSSSGLSLSPTTPNSQATRFVHPPPGIPGAVTINGQLIHTLPSPPIFSASSSVGNSTNQNAAAVTLNNANQVPQPHLIPVPLVQLPAAPGSTSQPLSFIPSLGQGSPLITQGGAVSQQQVVMLLPSPAVANQATRDVVALSPPSTAIAKLHQQPQQNNTKQSAPLASIQVLQQAAATNGQLEAVQTSSAPLTVLNEEEQLRLQIAHLQQQLLQSQQAQLLAQQQVAHLQMKQHVGEEMIEKPERQASPVSPVKPSTSKVTIVTSSWPAGCGNTIVASPAASKSQPLITSPSSPSPPTAAMARKASGQIVLSSMPILSPTGQTVLPTQLPVMLGQPTAPQVIPIVQSQGVSQRQILYMTPSTS